MFGRENIKVIVPAVGVRGEHLKSFRLILPPIERFNMSKPRGSFTTCNYLTALSFFFFATLNFCNDAKISAINNLERFVLFTI